MTVRSNLRSGELCPLHRSKRCACHGPDEVRLTRKRKYEIRTDGTRVFPDGREVCAPGVLKRRKDQLIKQDPSCIACGEGFKTYEEIELAHKESKGNGGFKRDDRWPNLALMHKNGNRRQGSKPLEYFLAECKAKGINPCQE
jgi:hypothetical protein